MEYNLGLNWGLSTSGTVKFWEKCVGLLIASWVN